MPGRTPFQKPIAKKRFGQHFLHDPAVIARILRSIDPQPGDALVEIGPGEGALTGPLLERAGALTAIEIDRDLVPRLRATFGPALTLVQADALQVDFCALATPGTKLRLTGNLPYNISTPLLFHVLAQAECIRDMHFMLQQEVVDRICAAPDTADYGRLTVSLAARAEAVELFSVGAGAFRPAPRVESAVVRITPRPPPFVLQDIARFDRLVRQAFGQRRKTLGNALRGLCGPAGFEAAGIDPKSRAETLSPAEFARLSNSLT
jgi:16S rRNA (adenine1518-N6/adenine1519-N6)-dimethyltransferase